MGGGIKKKIDKLSLCSEFAKNTNFKGRSTNFLITLRGGSQCFGTLEGQGLAAFDHKIKGVVYTFLYLTALGITRLMETQTRKITFMAVIIGRTNSDSSHSYLSYVFTFCQAKQSQAQAPAQLAGFS